MESNNVGGSLRAELVDSKVGDDDLSNRESHEKQEDDQIPMTVSEGCFGGRVLHALEKPIDGIDSI